MAELDRPIKIGDPPPGRTKRTQEDEDDLNVLGTLIDAHQAAPLRDGARSAG